MIEDKEFCDGYIGLACVDGSCPKIDNLNYHCVDCFYYRGCEDCACVDTDLCDKNVLIER